MTLLDQLVLGPILDATVVQTAIVPALIVVVLVASLELCFGMLMPLGLRTVSGLRVHGQEYVAWCWAVNGSFSVVGEPATARVSGAREKRPWFWTPGWPDGHGLDRVRGPVDPRGPHGRLIHRSDLDHSLVRNAGDRERVWEFLASDGRRVPEFAGRATSVARS